MSRVAEKSSLKQTGRRFANGLNAGVAILLAATLVLMVNYLAFRYYKRVDLSAEQYYSLSPKSHALLASVTNRINITVVVQPDHALARDIHHLLEEYQLASRYVNVDYLDPHRDLARVEELAVEYDLEDANVILFESAGRVKLVDAKDIVEYDYSPVRFGQLPEQVAFKGEQVFSSAIQNISLARRPVVIFLQGHDERNINEHDRRLGYSDIARLIRQDNMEVRTVTLGLTNAIPSDCDALVIAGIEDDLVVDATRTLSGRELYVNEYAKHPVTAGFAGETTVFYMPRSVTPIGVVNADKEPADRPQATPLFFSSKSGWAEKGAKDGVLNYDPLFDRPGPVCVAMAVEKGPVPGIDVRIQPTRMVVFGDSDFASNGGMIGGNANMFMAALNWLVERDNLMDVRSRAVVRTRLVMTRHDLLVLFSCVVIGVPAIVALLGLCVWFRRRY